GKEPGGVVNKTIRTCAQLGFVIAMERGGLKDRALGIDNREEKGCPGRNRDIEGGTTSDAREEHDSLISAKSPSRNEGMAAVHDWKGEGGFPPLGCPSPVSQAPKRAARRN